MLQFDCDKELTLDESAFIQVYSGQEYIFSMPCNLKELLDLRQAVDKGIHKIKDERDMNVIQKSEKFWEMIRNKGFDGIVDYPTLLKEYREHKDRFKKRAKPSQNQRKFGIRRL